MVAELFASLVMSLAPGVKEEPLAKGTAISFEAQTLRGAPIGTEDLKGKPTLIVLWGTSWMTGSLSALDEAERLHKKYGDKLRVVALSNYDVKKDVLSFAESNPGYKMEFWVDTSERKGHAVTIAAKVFKAKEFPSAYVLDKDCKVGGGIVGFKSGDNIEAFIR
ncbi:MAG: TlpA family protein disulfide reductase [Armatimonadetes bacterium]|nr:TlpA family protein disulfide reductase [Armatimonadota bacterium]